MSLTDTLGPVIVTAMKAVTGPLLERIARLDAQLAQKLDAAALHPLERRLADAEEAAEEARVRTLTPGPEGERGEDGAEGKAGAPGERGADGLPGPPGLQGERGADGVIGLKGDPGRDGLPGRDGMPGPKGHDGIHGKDGSDGLGFEDVELVHDLDAGTLTFCYRRGDRLKTVTASWVQFRDCGPWMEGQSYGPGSGVTYARAYWITNAATTEKPGDGPTAWRMVIKSPRDGAEGKVGPVGPAGPKGEKGEPGRLLR